MIAISHVRSSSSREDDERNRKTRDSAEKDEAESATESNDESLPQMTTVHRIEVEIEDGFTFEEKEDSEV